jgi:hypothetical protein
LEFETVIPFQFDGFARLEHSANFFMVENGKFKLYDTKTNQPIADMQFDQVGWEKYGWIWFKKDNEYGLMAMKTEKITPQKTIESKFSLKWETPIGQTTYRTNIMFANAQIVVG